MLVSAKAVPVFERRSETSPPRAAPGSGSPIPVPRASTCELGNIQREAQLAAHGSLAPATQESSSSSLVLTLPEALSENTGLRVGPATRPRDLSKPRTVGGGGASGCMPRPATMEAAPAPSRRQAPRSRDAEAGSRQQPEALPITRYCFGADTAHRSMHKMTSPLKPQFRTRRAAPGRSERPVDEQALFGARPVVAAPICEPDTYSPSMVQPPPLPSSPTAPGLSSASSGALLPPWATTSTTSAHGSACGGANAIEAYGGSQLCAYSSTSAGSSVSHAYLPPKRSSAMALKPLRSVRVSTSNR